MKNLRNKRLECVAILKSFKSNEFARNIIGTPPLILAPTRALPIELRPLYEDRPICHPNIVLIKVALLITKTL